MQTSPHVLVDGALFVFGSVAISSAVLWVVRRAVPHQRLTPHYEVSGFVYAAIGVIYAVLVGFAVITVWEEIRDAEANAIHEANAAADLYRLAGGLPDPTRSMVREAVLAYTRTVIDVEWDAMYDRRGPSDEAVARIDALWQALTQVQPSTATQTEVVGQSFQQLDQLSESRSQRLIDSESGLPGLLWAALITGAALTVLFPCVFGVENGALHALIIATLAATLGLLLFLTYDLDHPYSGDVRVSPEGFTYLLEQFTASSASR